MTRRAQGSHLRKRKSLAPRSLLRGATGSVFNKERPPQGVTPCGGLIVSRERVRVRLAAGGELPAARSLRWGWRGDVRREHSERPLRQPRESLHHPR